MGRKVEGCVEINGRLVRSFEERHARQKVVTIDRSEKKLRAATVGGGLVRGNLVRSRRRLRFCLYPGTLTKGKNRKRKKGQGGVAAD